MKNILVSVIVPTKNEAKNLPRLIQSIQAQSYQNVEAVVVDTGSTDNTVSLAKKSGAKVFAKGPERSAARNFGAKKSKGKYLLFLDADMELSSAVIDECLQKAQKKSFKVLTIPEKTVGEGFFTRVRDFERQMYMGDPTIEVARFFDRDVFFEFGGYDEQLTGPEDYDLPYRVSKKYKIGRTTEYIFHHEANVSLLRLLKKKYYYASRGAKYASKHPELVKTQGNLLFRRAYIKHWKNFLKSPVLGISFIIVRFLEALAAVAGYISAVGVGGFAKTLFSIIKND